MDSNDRCFQDILDSFVFVNTPKKAQPPPKERLIGRHVAKSFIPSVGWETIRPRKVKKDDSSLSQPKYVDGVIHPVAELKGTRSWNHPVEYDQDFPKLSLGSCNPEFRLSVSRSLESIISKAEEDHKFMPYLTERQLKLRTQSAISLSDYKMVQNEVIRATSSPSRRTKWSPVRSTSRSTTRS